MDNSKKTGVLLLAFGGANSIEEVAPFIKNVLKGRLVTDELLSRSRERYSLIGGSSPLLDITRAQARALEERLNSVGGSGGNAEFKTYVGMRFWDPFIKDTIREMWADGIERAVAVIMAPHSSRASTGGYDNDVQAALKTTGAVPDIVYVGPWHTHPLYLEALTDNIKAALAAHPNPEKTLTIFSAHSLPVPMLKNDVYVKKLEETIARVTEVTALEALPLKSRLAYQSKGGGPVPWLGPDVEEVIGEAKAGGYEGVLVVPLGFVSDHIETLFDIDILFKETSEAAGLKYSRAESLNTNEKFIEMLAEVVIDRARGGTHS